MSNLVTNHLTVWTNCKPDLDAFAEACKEDGLFERYAPLKAANPDADLKELTWGCRHDLKASDISVSANPAPGSYSITFMTRTMPATGFARALGRFSFEKVLLLYINEGESSCGKILMERGEVVESVHVQDYHAIKKEMKPCYYVEQKPTGKTYLPDDLVEMVRGNTKKD